MFEQERFYLYFVTIVVTYDVFYAGGTLSNGIYVLDMSNPILNVNDNKRAKER